MALPLADYNDIDALSANVIRGLVLDALETSGGGHPGMPLGMADAATVLWARFLRHDPADPAWFDRDRYVQSAGHGSMLQYSLLHLAGYDLPLDELRRHRQLHSLTPGHPEFRRTAGVETTTGPLGQGFANGVGMALAEAMLAARFNRPGLPVIDHRTYVVVGDGCLEEGISHEAAALAGHLRLGKLIVLFDDNRVTIDGAITVSSSEDPLVRFEAYGWRVARVDGHDLDAVDGALTAAHADAERPTIIACRTTIGLGIPGREGTARAHACTFESGEARRSKQAVGLSADETYQIPEAVRARWGLIRAAGEQAHAAWRALVDRYAVEHPAAAAELASVIAGDLPAGWDADLPDWSTGEMVTPRAASLAVLDAVVPRIGSLVGGCADLSDSCQVMPASAVAVTPGDFAGGYIHYGIREHAMAGILNGFVLHGGILPYAGTYLVFADYMRPSIRLAALMGLGVVYVWTHDSVTVGPDGPTHQPVEQLASLRSMPGLVTIRPADARETVGAWRYALEHRDRPVAMLLAKQDLPVLPVSSDAVAVGVARGAYIVRDAASGRPDVILLSAGSEVSLALEAAAELSGSGVAVRVVSMPSWRLFEEQEATYRESVLPRDRMARVSVEAGVTFGWDRYVGGAGEMIGIDRFGECGPGEDVLELLGVTSAAVCEAARRVVALASLPATPAASVPS
jgi:transketolase